MRIFTLAAVLMALLPPPLLAQDIVGRASVIDGDTIEVRGVRIRLSGIDAPEGRQMCQKPEAWRCGQQSALALSDKLGQANVRCEGQGQDRYGRVIAVCHLGDVDVNGWLVREGWAVAYRKYSLDYVDAEDAARQSQAGIWGSVFIMPWDWRRGQRMTDQATAPDGCTIKGNISSGGKRIFHVPGQQHYEQTRISAGKGERWFCSEDEAVAAGWRKAER